VRGNWDASQLAFCRAASSKNASAVVFFELSQLLLLRRDAAAAAEWAQRALAIEPTSARTLGLLGDALVRIGKVSEARDAWILAAKLPSSDPKNVQRMTRGDFEEGQRALKQRDLARAERFFRRVLAFEPDHALAQAKLAVTLGRLGLGKSARYWAESARAGGSGNPAVDLALREFGPSSG
jgi:Flp pilus assembly protein TadD